jgi:hypothetical protein
MRRKRSVLPLFYKGRAGEGLEETKGFGSEGVPPSKGGPGEGLVDTEGVGGLDSARFPFPTSSNPSCPPLVRGGTLDLPTAPTTRSFTSPPTQPSRVGARHAVPARPYSHLPCRGVVRPFGARASRPRFLFSEGETPSLPNTYGSRIFCRGALRAPTTVRGRFRAHAVRPYGLGGWV